MKRLPTTELIEMCEAVMAGKWIDQFHHYAENIRDHLRQMIESDDYLRAIRSEELDGSEPALGELLEANTDLFNGVQNQQGNQPQ